MAFDLKNIADKVVDYAPGIAAILAATGVGAPAAGAVAALGALGKACGLGDKATPEAIDSVLQNASPELKLQIMQAENSYKIAVMQDQTENFKLQLADVQNARAADVDKTKATGSRDINLYVLSWIIVLGFFGLMGILLFVPTPPDQSGVLFMLFGALSAGFGTVLSFFFGSNKSSELKTNMLWNSSPANQPKKSLEN